jgi:hypothetical protein
MTDIFKPPIKSRTTDDLLEILGSPKKWNPEAIRMAKYELKDRNVPQIEIDNAVKLSLKAEENERLRKANESYHVLDFLSHLDNPIFELIFSWELKKDGYILKAKQQKSFRILLSIVIFIVIINYFFTYFFK